MSHGSAPRCSALALRRVGSTADDRHDSENPLALGRVGSSARNPNGQGVGLISNHFISAFPVSMSHRPEGKSQTR